MVKKERRPSTYDSMVFIIDEIFKAKLDGIESLKNNYEEIPAPAVRRIARDLRNELLAKIKLLQEEDKKLAKTMGGPDIEQNKTNVSTIVNTSNKKEIMGHADMESTSLTEFEKCREKFAELKPSLIKNPDFKGKYVAIVNDEVVDHDSDEETLAKRVYKKFGYVYTFIGLVTEKEKPVRIPSVFGARR